jgi:radical SAM superfamily enzyme YgiQ (UPF0313 family)
MTKPTVYLADLRHDFQGILSTDTMPLSVGYMKAVMDNDLPEVNSTLFAYPDKLLNAIKQQPPHVLMLSNYMWNEHLTLYFAQLAKTIRPETLVVIGGPNIPIENERKILYVEQHPEIDLYATGEGDFYAAEMVKKFLEHGMEIKKLLQQTLHSTVYKFNSEQVITTPITPRSRNLDDIPSPWLSGILDEFFDGKLAPLFETNRGCPFTCTFCVQGTKWYSKINYFSRERLREEIHYIGKKIQDKCPQQKLLHIADSNYGMYEQDIDVSTYLGEAQKLYNWPLIIDATTGKNRAEIIIKNLEKLNGAMVMYQAVQSLDETVLENIKRNNIKLETYEQLLVHIHGRGLRSNSDLILGLPGDSQQSHLTSLKKLINRGISHLNNFQSILLKGSELDTKESREKYKFATKFRLLPKSFGEYNSIKNFEADEIIVSSSTLSFEEYLDTRIYHLLISIFWNDSRFDPLVLFLEKTGYEKWDFIQTIYDNLSSLNPEIQKLIKNFVEETKAELFDSEEELYAFYSQSENFEKIKRSEIGDNLIYKYQAISLYWMWDAVCNSAFEIAGKMIPETASFNTGSNEWKLFYNEWKTFTLNSYAFGRTIEEISEDRKIGFRYDVSGWLKNEQPFLFVEYKTAEENLVHFQLTEEYRQNLKGAFDIWSYELTSLSMLVRRVHRKWFKREVKVLQLIE